METCGKCRHFCRAKENVKDLCGAWEQPTFAKREACGFFMPKARFHTQTNALPDNKKGVICRFKLKCDGLILFNQLNTHE